MIMSPEDIKNFEEQIDQAFNIMESNSKEISVNNSRYIKVLQLEIEHLKSLFEDHDTGHLRTAVNVLEHRVQELEQMLK